MLLFSILGNISLQSAAAWCEACFVVVTKKPRKTGKDVMRNSHDK